jgi:hypothetical protein
MQTGHSNERCNIRWKDAKVYFFREFHRWGCLADPAWNLSHAGPDS